MAARLKSGSTGFLLPKIWSFQWTTLVPALPWDLTALSTLVGKPTLSLTQLSRFLLLLQ